MPYTWTTPKTDYATNNIVTASQLNDITNDVGYLAENNVLFAAASADLTLTTTWQDVSNCSLSLAKTGTWIVRAHVMFIIDTADKNVFYKATIHHNGSQVEPNHIQVMSQHASGLVHLPDYFQWNITVGSTPYTVKLQSKYQSGGTGVSILEADKTFISAEWLKP